LIVRPHRQRLRVSLKSASQDVSFGRFTLDRQDRRLRRDGEPVELSARYFDALALLVGEAGMLVTKDRFMGEVWRGVPVTDEALTQCIKELRRALGDEATSPRFIETVPKHGYRFVAPIAPAGGAGRTPLAESWGDTMLIGAAGTVGGGFAGFLGGLIYGFAAASQPLQPGLGAMSIVLVILSLTVVVALMGGLGVSFGIAIATRIGDSDIGWSVAGGALGGLIVGALVKLLGIDAFNLLFGRSPAGMTGALEGLLLGGTVGLGAWLSSLVGGLRKGMVTAALMGGSAGSLIPLIGGRLMGGSLDLLSRTFADSRLRLDAIGALLGEQGFGPMSQIVTGALEGE
jgi:DNA-binding winged helix-turn-helix (wHTH) protein